MTPTPRMRKALQQVEAHRIELERAIVDDLAERFFAEPGPEIRDSVIHLGLAATRPSEGHGTGSAAHFSLVWLG